MSTIFRSIEYAETDLESREFEFYRNTPEGYPRYSRDNERGTKLIATIKPYQGREVEVVYTKCRQPDNI